MCIKSDFKEICFKFLANDRGEQAVSIDIKLLSPGSCLPLTGGYIHLSTHEKKCIKSRGWRDFFLNLQQMTKVMGPSCWHQNFGPNGLSAPAQELCTCIKSWANMHTFREKNYFLKRATSDQSDKTFLFPSKTLSRRVVSSCPGAIYTCMK